MDPSRAPLAVLFIVSLPVVAALPSRSDPPYLAAPPLEIANLAAHGLFLFATLVQLAIALPTLFRVQERRLPAGGAVFALTILTVHYALGIGDILATFMLDPNSDRHRVFSGIPYVNLETAYNLFSRWADPAVFAAIAIVLHNRYRTVQKSVTGAIIAFDSVASLLFVIMVGLAAARQGLDASTAKTQLRNENPLDETSIRHIVTTLQNLHHAFVAFLILATIFLTVSAFFVNNRTKKDTVTKFTLRVIIPPLLIRALARLLFDIIVTQLSSPSTDIDLNVFYALDFASTLIYGFLYLIVMSVLVFLLLRVRLWGAQPHSTQATSLPPAQFPGQWGYPQPQYAYVPVYPTANPGTTGMPLQLLEDKAQISSKPPPPFPLPLP